MPEKCNFVCTIQDVPFNTQCHKHRIINLLSVLLVGKLKTEYLKNAKSKLTFGNIYE